MTKNLIFIKPKNKENQIINDFNLQEVLKNDRTHIYQNKELRMSFDKEVIRVLVFNSEDKNLIETLEKYFYEE